MTGAVAIAPLDVTCPWCGATPGTKCVTINGLPYTGRSCAHRARRALAGDAPPPAMRQLTGRLGGLTSWANTVDRTKRTAPARKQGPGSIEYWLAKQDPEHFADATEEQRTAAAQAAKKAHYAKLAAKSAIVRAKKSAKK